MPAGFHRCALLGLFRGQQKRAMSLNKPNYSTSVPKRHERSPEDGALWVRDPISVRFSDLKING